MASFLTRRPQRILIDVDTQVDLLNASQQHTELLLRFRRLMAWARLNQLSVISTALANRPSTNGNSVLNCIEDTAGQRKIGYTTLANRIRFNAENRFDLPDSLFENYQQVIFEKRSDNPFVMPRADRLLSELKLDRFIVFGMGAESAVKATVLGLLNRKKKVVLVSDAVGYTNHTTAILAFRQMQAKGAKLIKTVALTNKAIKKERPTFFATSNPYPH